MDRHHIFLPARPTASSFLEMATPQSHYNGEDEERIKTELTRPRHPDASRNISREVGGSSMTSGKGEGDADVNEKEIAKHRYAFQTRSQVDILDDGYRWRKYGQKAVKNSKFPRSYYKCTHNGCKVKKQVQRNSKEEEIVVTTYEGKHTHPTEMCRENFAEIVRQIQNYTLLSNGHAV